MTNAVVGLPYIARRVVLIPLALLAGGAAGAALFAAGLIDRLACDVESSDACERHELARLRMHVAAAAAAIPSIVLAGALVARKRVADSWLSF
jgi:hypothetical protein